MGRLAASSENGAAARRGQIVQRVLVDGWNPMQAASVFGVGERDVVRWVAAYRRHGMASLRGEMAQRTPLRWLRRLRQAVHRLATVRPAERASAELAPFVLPRHRGANGSRR